MKFTNIEFDKKIKNYKRCNALQSAAFQDLQILGKNPFYLTPKQFFVQIC